MSTDSRIVSWPQHSFCFSAQIESLSEWMLQSVVKSRHFYPVCTGSSSLAKYIVIQCQMPAVWCLSDYSVFLIYVNISKCVFFSPKFKTSQDGLGNWYHSLIDAVTTWQGADNVECTIVIKLVLDQLSNKTSVDIDALINWSYFRNGLQKSIYCLKSSQISVSANFRLRKPRSKTRVWQLLAGVDIGHWSDNLWGRCQSWQSDGKYCWG